MKLSALHEASYVGDNRFQILERVLNDVKKHVEGKIGINDIAAFCAAMIADHLNSDYDEPQFFDLAMGGLPKLKDNPQAINEQLKTYFDAETGEDYESLAQEVIEYVRNRRK